MAIKFLNTVQVDTDVLYVDAANDRVGIGTDSPDALLDLGTTGGQKFYVYSGSTVKAGMGVDLSGSSRELSIFNSSSNGYSDGNISFGYRNESNGAYQERMRLTSGGNLGIGTTSPTYKLDVAGGAKSTFYTSDGTRGFKQDSVAFVSTYSDGSNGNAANDIGSTTNKWRDGYFSGTVTAANFVGTTGAYLPLAGGTMTGTNGVLFPDNFILNIGNSSDLKISHDGTDSFIEDSGTGSLYVTTNAFRLLNPAENEQIITAFENGAVNLFYDSSQKFETTTFGSKVTGYLQVTSGVDVIGGNIDLVDNSKIRLGTSQDLQIYHDGSNSYIKDTGTGDLILNVNNFRLKNAADSEIYLFAQDGGGVNLYHTGNAIKLQTTSTGVTVTGAASATTFLGDLNGTINTVTTAFTKPNATNDTTVATTAFVQNLIGTIPAGLVFQGTWNAATNTPTLTSGSGTTGHFYIVSTSGSTNLDGITDWKVGDWAVFIEQGASDQWEKIDNSSVLDGIGTGQTLPLWAGSGTSNTLTDSNIKQDSSGNIGIGSGTITSPPQDIALTIQSTTNTSRLILKNSSTGVGSNDGFRIGAVGTNVEFEAKDSGDFQFFTAATQVLTIKSSGDVGIGTASPSEKLHVVGNAFLSANSAFKASYNNTDSYHGSMRWAGLQLGNNGVNKIVAGRTVAGGSFQFWTNNTNDAANYTVTADGIMTMAMTNAGNVGIGTTAPTRTLDIRTDSGVLIKGATGTMNAKISFLPTSGGRQYDLGNVGADFRIFDASAGTTRMYFDNTGDTGIGTTTPQSTLQVAGGIQMADDTDIASANKVGTMRYRTGTEYVEVTGTEIVTNGDFLSSPASSGWVVGSGWTIATGSAAYNAAAIYNWINSSVGTVVGNIYRVSFDCTITSGDLRVVLANGGATPSITATGSYEYILTPTGGGSYDTLIRVYQTVANSNFSITNISAVEVTAEDASYADMCMQTGASTYEWVNIVRNTY